MKIWTNEVIVVCRRGCEASKPRLSPARGVRPRTIALIIAASLALWMMACGDSAQPRAATVSGVPDWVPIYPGAKVSSVETRKAGIETYTIFKLDTSADCYKVVLWYHEQMRLAGFNVSNPATPLPDHCTAGVGGNGPGHTRSFRLYGGGATGGPSKFEMQAVVRELPGSDIPGPGAIPAWVPQYPGSKPANLVARQSGGERTANFHFVTSDKAQAVIGWYERQLKAAKFTIVNSAVFDDSTAKLAAQDAATGRSMLNIRIEPAGARKVVAIEARDAGR